MTNDEAEARSLHKDNLRLRERIEVLERRLKPKPAGTAVEAFNEFWQAEGMFVRGKSLAQLAFDAGHALRHKKEDK